MKKLLQIPLAVIFLASVNAYAEDLVGKKLMAKLRARMDDFKKAYESDCVSAHGKDKAKECKCFIEKTDFDETLKQLEQQMLNKDQRDEIQKQMGEKENEIKRACNL